MGHDVILAGRGETVDRPGLVGPQNRTEHCVILGLDAGQVGHVPASTVDPDVVIYRSQSVPDDPLGQDKMLRPVETEGMHAVNGSDRPTAGGPVGRLLELDPSGHSGVSSSDDFCQQLAVGPVGQPCTTGPQDDRVRESDYERTSRIDNGPESPTGLLDPVSQTGKKIRTDHIRIDTVNEPASAGDSILSSDSGVHSWKEQWENMSENSIYGASEQTDSLTYRCSRRGNLGDIRMPPNTEEEGDSDYPWAERLLSKESDGFSSNVVYHSDGRLLYSVVTGEGSDSCAATSGNIGGRSDIAVVSDSSDDMEETGVSLLSAGRLPYGRYDGRVVNMKGGPDGLPDMDDSDCESNASDRVFRTDQESQKLGPTVQPMMVAGDVVPIPRDQPVDHERGSVAGNGVDVFSVKMSNLCDRPVGNWEPEWDGEVPQERGDPGYWDYIYLLAMQALKTGEDTRVNDKYSEVVTLVVDSVKMVGKGCYEHDRRLEEQQTGCTSPGCQCHRRLDLMFRELNTWSETDDSELEDIADGTFTPPLRKKRGRKYTRLRKYGTDIEDYFSDTSEEEYWMQINERVRSLHYAKVDTSKLRDGSDTGGQNELTGLTECGVYSSNAEVKGSVDRPVNSSVTA